MEKVGPVSRSSKAKSEIISRTRYENALLANIDSSESVKLQ